MTSLKVKKFLKKNYPYILIGGGLIAAGVVGFEMGRNAFISEQLYEEASTLISKGIVTGLDLGLDGKLYFVFN